MGRNNCFNYINLKKYIFLLSEYNFNVGTYIWFFTQFFLFREKQYRLVFLIFQTHIATFQNYTNLNYRSVVESVVCKMLIAQRLK